MTLSSRALRAVALVLGVSALVAGCRQQGEDTGSAKSNDTGSAAEQVEDTGGAAR